MSYRPEDTDAVQSSMPLFHSSLLEGNFHFPHIHIILYMCMSIHMYMYMCR